MKSLSFFAFFLLFAFAAMSQSIVPYTVSVRTDNATLGWDASQFESWMYTQPNSVGGTDRLPFRLLKPVNYNANPTKLYPIIYMLHGQGEKGTDNFYQLKNGGQIHLAAVNNAVNAGNTSNPGVASTTKFDGFVVFPQEPDGDWTNYPDYDQGPAGQITTAMRQFLILVDSLNLKYRIDPNRVIVHGLSSGGTGTWVSLYNRPDLFAAALPMSAPGTLTQMGRLAPIPIWLSQGGKDTNPIPYISEQEVQALRDSGAVDPTVTKYSEYADLGHGVWDRTYNDTGFFAYILRQNKGNIAVLGNNPVCPGTTVTLGLSPGFYAYEWYFGNTLLVGQTSNKLRNISAAGSYYARFKRSNAVGQVFVTTNTVTITLAPAITKPAITVDNSLILGSPSGYYVNLTTTTADQYQWSNSSTTQTISSSGNAGDYTVRVKPTGNICWSPYSDPSKVRYSQVAPFPAAPTSVTAVALSSNSVSLSWNDNATNETGYEVYRVKDNQYAAWSYLGLLPANSTSYVDNTASASSLYYYKIRAVNAGAATENDANANITTPAPSTFYYSLATGNLYSVATWGTSTNGSGAHPANFTNGNQVFVLANRSSETILTNAWTVSGTASKIVVGNNFQLTVSAGVSLSGSMDILSGSIVKFNGTTFPTLTYIDPTSTIYAASTASLSNLAYGNLNLNTSGDKTFTKDTVDVKGNLTLASSIRLVGKPSGTVIRLSGDLIYSDASPTFQNMSIRLFKDSQQIDAKGGTILLNELLTKDNSTVQILGGSNLSLGSSSGGGLTLGKNATLNIGSGSIYITGSGALNPDSTKNSMISSTSGSIYLNSTTNSNSYLKPVSTGSTFKDITNYNNGNKSFSIVDTVRLTGTLKLGYGSIRTNNKLILVSNLSGTARISKVEANASLVGSVIWQRIIGPNKTQSSYYLSSPIKNKRIAEFAKYFTLKGFKPTEGTSISTWEEPSNVWVGIRDSNVVLIPGKGYRINIKTQDIKYASNSAFFQHSGSPVIGNGSNSNVLPFYIPISNISGGWNLIGNPYPCEIDWNAATGWNKSSIDNSFYLWDGTTRSYKVYKGSGGTGSPSVSTFLTTSIINSGQGFMVKAIPSANPSSSISLTEDVKTFTVTPTALYRQEEEDIDPLIRIKMQNGKLSDEAVVRFYKDATLSYDVAYDAIKYPGTGLNISSSMSHTEKLTINTLPFYDINMVVPVYVQAYSGGEFNLNFTGSESFPPQTQIFLYDRVLDSTITVGTSTSYSFKTLTSFEDSTRFELRFKKISSDQVLAYEEGINFVQRLNIFPNPSEGKTVFQLDLKNESNLQLNIFNPEGREVYHYSNLGQEGTNNIDWSLDRQEHKGGIYFYRLNINGKDYNGKIIVL